jgi:hypothetical protein
MANTIIQILRSYANTRPTTLDDGEMAYSFASNTLFIGSRNSQIVEIGGPNYIANVTINVVDGGTFT